MGVGLEGEAGVEGEVVVGRAAVGGPSALEGAVLGAHEDVVLDREAQAERVAEESAVGGG